MAHDAGKRRRSRAAEVRDRQEADAVLDVSAVMEELGEQATAVSLWRMNGAEEQYMDRVPAAEFSMDYVRKHPFGGGGRYRIRVAGPRDGKGRTHWIRTHTFTIAGPPNVGGEGSGGAPAREPMPPWAQVMLAAVPAVAGALAARLMEKPQADPVLVAILDKMGKGGDGPSTVEVQQLVETARNSEFEKGRAMGRAEAMAENPPRGGDADGPLTTAIKELGPALVETMRSGGREQRPARAMARVAGGEEAAATATAAPAAAVPAMAEGAAPAWVARVRPFLRVVLGWADSGKNATVKAMSLLDDLGEADMESLAVSCESDTFVQDVFRYLPELGSTPVRREWFTTFLVSIQDALTTDDEEEEHGTPEGHGAGDTDSAPDGDGAPGADAGAGGRSAAPGGDAGGGGEQRGGGAAGGGAARAGRAGGRGAGQRRPAGGPSQ